MVPVNPRGAKSIGSCLLGKVKAVSGFYEFADASLFPDLYL